MSITDELREIAAKTERASGRCEKLYRGDLDHIADRIDERIEREYVKLPVDADGVPTRVGDTIEIEHNGRVTTVTNINYSEHGWQVYCAEGGGFDKDTRFHHVQHDSWERIIEDAAKLARGDNDAVMELVERCRRLAEKDFYVRAFIKWATEEQPEVKRLEAENAKLRKLVRDMWFWCYEGHMDTESQEWQMKHINGVLDRMCELEIEV